MPRARPSSPNQVRAATAVTGTGPYNVTFGWTANGANAWNLTGNTGTTPGTNYLGTIDNQDLVLKTHAVEAMHVLGANQFIGIGTNTPQQLLSVKSGNLLLANA